MKVRLWLGVAGATVVAALVILTVIWFTAAGQVEASLDTLKQEAAAQGIELTFDKPRIGGFPFRVAFALENLKVTMPALGLVYEIPPLPISRSIYGGGPVVIDSSGHHTYRLNIGGKTLETTVDAEEGHEEVVVAAPDKWTVTSTVRAATVTSTAGTVSDSIVGSSRMKDDSATGTFYWPSSGPGSVAFAYDVHGIQGLGPDGKPIFTQAIDRIHVDAITTLPPRGSKIDLAAWQSSGGSLVLRELTAEWNGATLKAVGTISLDERLHPVGALDVTVDGFAESVQKLAAAGTLPPDGAATVLQRAGPYLVAVGDGKPSRLALSFVFANGVLLLNEVPVSLPGINPG